MEPIPGYDLAADESHENVMNVFPYLDEGEVFVRPRRKNTNFPVFPPGFSPWDDARDPGADPQAYPPPIPKHFEEALQRTVAAAQSRAAPIISGIQSRWTSLQNLWGQLPVIPITVKFTALYITSPFWFAQLWARVIDLYRYATGAWFYTVYYAATLNGFLNRSRCWRVLREGPNRRFTVTTQFWFRRGCEGARDGFMARGHLLEKFCDATVSRFLGTFAAWPTGIPHAIVIVIFWGFVGGFGWDVLYYVGKYSLWLWKMRIWPLAKDTFDIKFIKDFILKPWAAKLKELWIAIRAISLGFNLHGFVPPDGGANANQGVLVERVEELIESDSDNRSNSSGGSQQGPGGGGHGDGRDHSDSDGSAPGSGGAPLSVTPGAFLADGAAPDAVIQGAMGVVQLIPPDRWATIIRMREGARNVLMLRILARRMGGFGGAEVDLEEYIAQNWVRLEELLAEFNTRLREDGWVAREENQGAEGSGDAEAPLDVVQGPMGEGGLIPPPYGAGNVEDLRGEQRHRATLRILARGENAVAEEDLDEYIAEERARLEELAVVFEAELAQRNEVIRGVLAVDVNEENVEYDIDAVIAAHRAQHPIEQVMADYNPRQLTVQQRVGPDDDLSSDPPDFSAEPGVELYDVGEGIGYQIEGQSEEQSDKVSEIGSDENISEPSDGRNQPERARELRAQAAQERIAVEQGAREQIIVQEQQELFLGQQEEAKSEEDDLPEELLLRQTSSNRARL